MWENFYFWAGITFLINTFYRKRFAFGNDGKAMIGAAFPCGLADMLWEEFWVGLEDIWAVGRLGRPPCPTRGCWRAKPGCICSRDELAADPKIEFDDAKIGEEATEATGKLPGAAGETSFQEEFGFDRDQREAA